MRFVQPGVPRSHQRAVLPDRGEALEVGFDALADILVKRVLLRRKSGRWKQGFGAGRHMRHSRLAHAPGVVRAAPHRMPTEPGTGSGSLRMLPRSVQHRFELYSAPKLSPSRTVC